MEPNKISSTLSKPETPQILPKPSKTEKTVSKSTKVDDFLQSLKKETKKSIKEQIRDSTTQIERLFSRVWKNPFDCLLLDRDATESEIKKRYRLFNLALHPDKCSHEKATQALEVVKQAYETLKSVEKRKIYQRIMREAFERCIFERKMENKKRAKKGLPELPEHTFETWEFFFF